MEHTTYDKKSLKLFTGKNPDWKSLAKDCVCFANAKGGKKFRKYFIDKKKE